MALRGVLPFNPGLLLHRLLRCASQLSCSFFLRQLVLFLNNRILISLNKNILLNKNIPSARFSLTRKSDAFSVLAAAAAATSVAGAVVLASSVPADCSGVDAAAVKAAIVKVFCFNLMYSLQ